ncbi:hypothetical protein [Lichenibacterium ramalinae]|uniref:hypothetical protein n=1 Tax=Lichenibacterium ramalinae TaxID=2316527 RepID=UPI001FE0C03F|nr:hypothetical protein [Lichenibacterium ramalinae]
MRAVDIPAPALDVDLERTEPMLVAEAVEAVKQDGAEAILFGGPGLLGCATAVREGSLAHGIGETVIDPIANAVAVAAAMTRVGLAQSRPTYAMPPAKGSVGYPGIALPFGIGGRHVRHRARGPVHDRDLPPHQLQAHVRRLSVPSTGACP